MASPDYCADCRQPAAFKCLRCVEKVCRRCLERHTDDGCPSEEPDYDLINDGLKEDEHRDDE